MAAIPRPQELGAVLREYYPGSSPHSPRAAPPTSPAPKRAQSWRWRRPAAAKLTKTRIAAALRRAGRQRGIDALAVQLLHDFRKPQLRQPPVVEEAFGHQTLALPATLNTECASADQLTESTTAAFQEHPDYAIITSFPGLADLSGARVHGEIGDDRARFTDARSLKAYAGSAPVTWASGRSISIARRTVKNDRLNATGFVWAFASIGPAGAPRDHYQRRREHATGTPSPCGTVNEFAHRYGMRRCRYQRGRSSVCPLRDVAGEGVRRTASGDGSAAVYR